MPNETNITVFGNKDLAVEVRTITDEKREPWFIAKDVCDALGLTNSRKAVSVLDDDERVSLKVTSGGQVRSMQAVNESGLYALIMRSRKPNAKKFRKWVTSEVLPSIRKTGSYSLQQKASYQIEDPIERAKAWIAEQEQFKRTKAQIADKQTATALATPSNAVQKTKKLEIALDESKEYATVKRVEMLTGMSYGWRPLKARSKELGYEMKKVFDVNYGQVNSYHRNVWMEVYNIDIAEVTSC